MASYSYSPIDLSADAIRLLRLFRGYVDDPIRCEIFQTFLHEAESVPYEALSYTWGDCNSPLGNVQNDNEIIINEQKAMIGANLYLALCSLRQSNEDKILWVDAICIDQKNDGEKGHQVRQMSQIYAKAQTVQIWLGSATSNTNLLINRMKELDERVLKRSDYRRNSRGAWFKEWAVLLKEMGQHIPDGDFISREQQALVELFQRPWFQRVWIIQEVFNAKRAIIRCGRDTVPTRTFVMAPWLMRVEIDSHIQAVLDIMPGYLRATSWWRDRPSLHTLLIKFQQCRATDPRDKIYALIGIASDVACHRILQESPYGVTEREAICTTLRYLLFEQFPNTESLARLAQLPQWNLEEFFNALSSSKFYEDVLNWAKFTRNGDLLVAILAQTPVNVNTRSLTTTKSAPLLFLATAQWRGLDSTIQAILTRPDVDVNVMSDTSDMETPLCIAARTGNWPMATLLLDHPEIKFNQRDLVQIQALKATLQLESEHQAKVDVPPVTPSSNVLTPLYLAARSNFLDIAGLLLDKGASIEDKNGESEETALHVALRGGHLEMVTLLLDKGASIEDKNGESEETALHVALRGGHLKMVTLLLNRGAKLNLEDRRVDKSLVLWAAFGTDNEHAVQTLLDAGAYLDLKLTNDKGQSALCISCRNGWVSVTRKLLDAGADINTVGFGRQSALCAAAFSGSVPIVRLLLDRGADLTAGAPSQPDGSIWYGYFNPQIIADYRGHWEIAAMIREAWVNRIVSSGT
ncbi:ankyrin repeat-containing domain protein [Cladorrhinum sp. PSN332]|nr:ankyrin repeat-containing domain protein [Cladorrhinum sp. PSN332]